MTKYNSRTNKTLLIVAGAVAAVAVAEAIVFATGSTPKGFAAGSSPVPVIGDTPSTSPPKSDSPTPPPGTVSQGPAETGPHGQVDITKPMPNVPATSPRVAPDQNVQPQG